MTRLQRRAAVVTLALAALTVIGAGGARIATASPPPPCPASTQCQTRVIVTDGAPGMGAPWYVEDNEGHAPGQNAAMAWVDGFQMGSANPVCAVATMPYLAREACLGGPPFDATGGHPVLALWDGTRWQVLTAADIALVKAMGAAGITPRDLRLLARWLHATGR